MSARSLAGRAPYALYASAFSNGAVLAAIGPTLDALSSQTGATTGRISIVFTANGVGFVIGSLFGGRLFSRVKGTTSLAAAVAAMAVCTAAVPLLGSLWLAMVAFAGIGVANGMIGVGTNTLLMWQFESRAAPFINTLHLSFGVGAFLSPLIVDRFAVATDDSATAYFFLAVIMVPVALRLTTTDAPTAPTSTGGTSAGHAPRNSVRFLILVAALFVMHVGGQLSFAGWIFSYASDTGIAGSTSARVLNSVFWGSLVIGRLAAIPLSRRFSSRSMMHLDLIGAGASIALIAVLPDSSPALWIGTAGFGLSVASMYGTAVNYTGEHIRVTSQAMSALILGAGLGSMTLPWVTGQFFDSSGPASMLWVVGAAMAAAAALFGAMQLRTAGSRKPL